MQFDAFAASLSLVAVAEIGDKTQLLSILLAACFKRFWPIFAGVLVATLLNHALAAYAGRMLAGWLSGDWLWMATSALFILLGMWALIPDKEPSQQCRPRRNAFFTSLVTFFLAEIGDKTQIATLTLGAKYDDLAAVILGTTAGMLIANAPAIWMGEKLLKLIPLRGMRLLAGALFIGFGAWVAISHILG